MEDCKCHCGHGADAVYCIEGCDHPKSCVHCEKNKSWERRLSSEFEIIAKINGFRTGYLKDDIPFQKIKDFINSELSLARQQERQELLKEATKLKQELPKRPCVNAENHLFGSCFQCEKIKGYNQAIKEIINLIKDKS